MRKVFYIHPQDVTLCKAIEANLGSVTHCAVDPIIYALLKKNTSRVEFYDIGNYANCIAGTTDRAELMALAYDAKIGDLLSQKLGGNQSGWGFHMLWLMLWPYFLTEELSSYILSHESKFSIIRPAISSHYHERGAAQTEAILKYSPGIDVINVSLEDSLRLGFGGWSQRCQKLVPNVIEIITKIKANPNAQLVSIPTCFYHGDKYISEFKQGYGASLIEISSPVWNFKNYHNEVGLMHVSELISKMHISHIDLVNDILKELSEIFYALFQSIGLKRNTQDIYAQSFLKVFQAKLSFYLILKNSGIDFSTNHLLVSNHEAQINYPLINLIGNDGGNVTYAPHSTVDNLRYVSFSNSAIMLPEYCRVNRSINGPLAKKISINLRENYQSSNGTTTKKVIIVCNVPSFQGLLMDNLGKIGLALKKLTDGCRLIGKDFVIRLRPGFEGVEILSKYAGISEQELMVGSTMSESELINSAKICVGVGVPTSMLCKFIDANVPTYLLPTRDLHWGEATIWPLENKNVLDINNISLNFLDV